MKKLNPRLEPSPSSGIRIVIKGPDDAEAYYYLGKLYSKEGWTDNFAYCVTQLRELNRRDLLLRLAKNR